MRLSRALSDLVKYTKSVRVHDIETQGNIHEMLRQIHLLFSLLPPCINVGHLITLLCWHTLFAAHLTSWQVSSLNETVMNQILQLMPGQLVRFNQRQLLRVYPSNYRVDSSNFNPQPFWNAGCHMGKQRLKEALGIYQGLILSLCL